MAENHCQFIGSTRSCVTAKVWASLENSCGCRLRNNWYQIANADETVLAFNSGIVSSHSIDKNILEAEKTKVGQRAHSKLERIERLCIPIITRYICSNRFIAFGRTSAQYTVFNEGFTQSPILKIHNTCEVIQASVHSLCANRFQQKYCIIAVERRISRFEK